MRSLCTRVAGIAGLATILLLAGAAMASAGRVEARETRQRTRIHNGVEDGSLTRREAHRLGHEQVRIERTERRLRNNDGRLGPRERVRLDGMQDRASARIYKKRHNGRTR